MKRLSLMAAAALCAVAVSAQQQEPLWLRNTVISPDGSTVAFTFGGDIYTIPFAGGSATRLTSSPAYDTAPVWSPDGTRIAFGSKREGSMDIYVIDAAGGTPRRVTTHSGTETPRAWLNDSTILFSANISPARQAAQPGILKQVYKVSDKGGRPQLYASVDMSAISVDHDGRLLYQDRKGYEDSFRKHERSSGTGDIWLVDSGRYTQLTNFNGHDLNPVWIGTSDEFYYISEQDSTLNVYRRTIDGVETQLTHFRKHPVRSLSASADGNALVFSWNGEIYTLIPGSEPQKMAVNIVTDNYDSDNVRTYRSSGADNMAVSPEGKEVAFTLRGDVYVTSTKYETTKRVTNTDGQERCLSFSPDGKKLVYDSERDGLWQIFMAEVGDDDDNFTYADEITETLLYKGDKAAQQPVFSPDGKKVAFLEDRTELKVIDLKTKKVTTALPGEFNYSYSDGDVSFAWSPDSRWFLTSYIGTGGWNNTDIALVKADGSEVVDLTESGYEDSNPRWVMGGKGFTYESGKCGYRSHGSWGEESDVFLMMLDGDAWDEFNLTKEEAALRDKDEDDDDEDDEVAPLEFDLANRFYRTKRLTEASTLLVDYWMDNEGETLYYSALANDLRTNLYSVDLKEVDTDLITRSVGAGELIPDKDGDYLFINSSRGMARISLPDGDREDIDFEAEYSRKPSAERAYIFDHAVQQVKDKFYDADIHGIDWEGYADDYRRFLPWINNNQDFSDMLSELLGELNASHTGSRFYDPKGPALSTPYLGVFFDEDYDGDGLKIAEVLDCGPLSVKSAGIEAGDVITSIDGVEVLAGQDYFPLLDGKGDRKVKLGIRKPGGATSVVTVRPTDDNSTLLYRRWVERNEQVVDSLSGGRLGYVHVEGMDSESFRTVYSKLLGKYRNREGVIVDTRYNGGGWLHNDIAVLLSGHEYVRYAPRGRYIGSDPFSQWTKPSVMLVGECNYSDAHGTPYVYQTLGIGKVVGAPVPGTMTAVWWEHQIDPTLLFGIPQVTSLDRHGRALENQQLNPDVLVRNNPADEAAGIDAQLAAAVATLLEQLQ